MPYCSSNKIFCWGAVHIETLQLFWDPFLYFQVDSAVWHKPGKQNKTKSSLVFLVRNYQNQRKQNKTKDTENGELWWTWISLKQETKQIFTFFSLWESIKMLLLDMCELDSAVTLCMSLLLVLPWNRGQYLPPCTVPSPGTRCLMCHLLLHSTHL